MKIVDDHKEKTTMLYGEHLHAEEREDGVTCTTCPRRATEEVFDAGGRSVGCYCARCGRRKLEAIQGPVARLVKP